MDHLDHSPLRTSHDDGERGQVELQLNRHEEYQSQKIDINRPG